MRLIIYLIQIWRRATVWNNHDFLDFINKLYINNMCVYLKFVWTKPITNTHFARQTCMQKPKISRFRQQNHYICQT
jgi:hypothetical protein